VIAELTGTVSSLSVTDLVRRADSVGCAADGHVGGAPHDVEMFAGLYLVSASHALHPQSGRKCDDILQPSVPMPLADDTASYARGNARFGTVIKRKIVAQKRKPTSCPGRGADAWKRSCQASKMRKKWYRHAKAASSSALAGGSCQAVIWDRSSARPRDRHTAPDAASEPGAARGLAIGRSVHRASPAHNETQPGEAAGFLATGGSAMCYISCS
jgi:hypothetical protein